MSGRLYYGDNLDVLRRHVYDESVDLVYLDPPFNSNANYNVLFDEQDGARSAAQIKVFGDTWRWDRASMESYEEIVESGGDVSKTMQALKALLGESDMFAYIAMMAPRLVEMRRALKPTGSIYLHCDPTASHYLKVLMDAIFGGQNFKNEIVWRRTTTKNDYAQGATNWPRVHDVILYYARDARQHPTFSQPFSAYDDAYVKAKYPHAEEGTGRRYGLWDLTAPGSGSRGHPTYEFMGVTRYWRYNREKMQELADQGRVIQPRPGAVPRYKRYLDEMPGIAIGDCWDDIPPINSQAQERLGYPTQKPEALLERILAASSREGDLIMDPFCGCGTAVAAAEKMKRRWIGIDITHLAVNLIRHRLKDMFTDAQFDVIGEPVSVPDAEDLAEKDPYQFQWWALGLVGARPAEGKKGSDRGIDGRIFFHEGDGKTRQVILSVKAGKTDVTHLRDLWGVVTREKAQIGVLITMRDPTSHMRREAASAGTYRSDLWNQRYPCLQILTVAELMAGKAIEMPPLRQVNATFRRAPTAKEREPATASLPFD